MNKTTLSASNIYIENAALKHSNNLHREHVAYVGGKINAVENSEERYGRYVNSRMDFTR